MAAWRRMPNPRTELMQPKDSNIIEREPLAIRRAREYGIDVDRIRVMLEREPEERLRSLDESLRFFQMAQPTGRRPC